MEKTVIAIKGASGQGKSEVIKILYDLICTTYPVKILLHVNDGDVKAIIEINGVLVGIESQGDPYSRQPNSIKEFIIKECDIIISACRTRGTTADVLYYTKDTDYRTIWTGTYRMEQEITHTTINQLSAKHLLELFDNVLKGLI